MSRNNNQCHWDAPTVSAAARLQADNVTINCTATANCCSGTVGSGSGAEAGGSGAAASSDDTSGASSGDYGSASGSEATVTNDTSPTTAAPSGLLSVLPSVEWFFNGNLITSYNSTSSAQTITNLLKYGFDTDPFSPTYGHLTLVNIVSSDTGQYRCVASNADGSQSSSVRLQVQGMSLVLHTSILYNMQVCM